MNWSRAEKACLCFVAVVILTGFALVGTMPLYVDWLMGV